MEEFHKTIIQVNDSSSSSAVKQGPPTAPKPVRQAPVPQPRTLTKDNKKKGPPPKPPAKPVRPKKSEEEEVLKQLDDMLEHAFDFEVAEDDALSSGTDSKSSSLQRGTEPVSSASEPNSRTGSLQRNENLQQASTVTTTTAKTDMETKSDQHSTIDNTTIDSKSALTPDEPEPDYPDEDEGHVSNTSPISQRHGVRKDISSPNKELMGDSGISEGSTECLDKVSDSAGNSLERKKINDSQEELPDYANISEIKRLSSSQVRYCSSEIIVIV